MTKSVVYSQKLQDTLNRAGYRPLDVAVYYGGGHIEVKASTKAEATKIETLLKTAFGYTLRLDDTTVLSQMKAA